MFCPTCGAEYRDGFTHCSDCAVPLISALPSSRQRPATAPSPFPPKEFLLWFIPLSVVASSAPFFLLTRLNPYGFHPLTVLVGIVHIVIPLGGYWMIYQAIRHEKRVGWWVLLALVPFMFIWYRVVRYPVRPKLIRIESHSEKPST